MNGRGIFFKSRSDGARLRYTVQELFVRRLGLQVSVTGPDEPLPESHLSIGHGLDGNLLSFPDSGILAEYQKKEFTCIPRSGLEASSLEDATGKSTPGDLPGLAFWLLSRYEEYQGSPTRDEHGRFPSGSMALVKQNLERFPVIESWLQPVREVLLRNGIQTLKPDTETPFSFDIDNPTAFRHKGFFRNLGGGLADLVSGKIQNLVKRTAVLSGFQPDPYQLPDSLLETLKLEPFRPVFFFWAGNYGPYDKGLDVGNPWFQSLVKGISRDFPIGLHPSYQSFLRPEQVQKERNRLQELTGKPVTLNRFHFLRFRMPDSFRMLEEMGFEADYSMGFADRFGFRAGTGLPFGWYDLEKEQAGKLVLHPFGLMDSTARFRLNLNGSGFVDEIRKIAGEARKCHSGVHTIFHNEHPSWSGWESVIESVLKYYKSER